MPSLSEHQTLSPSIQATPVGTESTKTAAAGDMLLELPLSFIENRGQLDSRVKYYAKLSGQTVYFTDEGITFDVVRYPKTEPTRLSNIDPQLIGERLAFSIDFVNANSSHVIDGMLEAPGKVNYLTGDDPQNWHTDIPLYREIVYRNIYPNIDLRFYGKDGLLEYELVVNPGASVDDIALAYSGVDSLRLEHGDLLVQTPLGEFSQEAPYIYQNIEGREMPVEGGFKLQGSTYGFHVAAYNRDYPLIIDPFLGYSSFLGGGGEDKALALASISEEIYITGYTNSSGFPTANSYNGTYAGNDDVFITKMDTWASGAASLVYSTYLGGSGDDKGNGIALEGGKACVVGDTESSDFPTANAYDDSYNGDSDVFVTMLSSAGNSLVYSTFFGGTDDDYGYGIDIKGYVFICGKTDSNTFEGFPISGALNGQNLFQGYTCSFIAKLDHLWSPPQPNNGLQHSTYLNGTTGHPTPGGAMTFVHDVVVVPGEYSCYVTGETNADGFPVDAYGYDDSYSGSAYDCFVAKVPAIPNSANLTYFTYLGGYVDVGSHCGNAIAYDTTDSSVHVVGYTYGSFPTTDYAYDRSHHGSLDAFYTKIPATLSSLDYSTYLGGVYADEALALDTVQGRYAYLTGYTNGAGFPEKNAFDSQEDNGDAWVAKIDSASDNESSLVYASFLGGSGEDSGCGIAVGAGGEAYICGYTASSNFPTRPNAYQTSFQGGTYDAFVAMVGYPVINVNPTSLAFGDVPYDPGQGGVGASKVLPMTFSNTGSGEAHMVGIWTSPPTPSGRFWKDSDNVTPSLVTGESGVVEVRFTPNAVSNFTGVLRYVYWVEPAENSEYQDLNLSGTGRRASYSLSKTGPSSARVGDNITYTVTITNTGNYNLPLDSVSDNVVGSLTNRFPATLAIDASANVTYSYIIPPGAPSQLSNQVTAHYHPEGWDSFDMPRSSTHTTAIEYLTVIKGGPFISKVGDNITYWAAITNISSETLVKVSVVDDKAGDVTGYFTKGTLSPGETDNATYPYLVQTGDPSPLVNMVTATYSTPDLLNHVASDNYSVTLVNPSLTVTKGGPVVSKVGDNVTFTITINNTGDWPLIRDSVSDNISVWPDPNTYAPFASIPASSSISGNFTYTVEATDPDPLGNMVIVHYHPEGLPNDISDNATCTVDLVHPGISVSKGGPAISKIGDNVTYWAAVTNTGDCTLVKDSVSDNVVAGINGLFADIIAPGVTDNQTYNYAVQPGDPDPLPNMVIVHYHPEGLPNDVTDNATCSVDLVHPSLSLSKTADNTISKVGDNINYTCTITNTSPDVALVRDSASDSLAGIITGSFPATLAPGVSANVTYPYTVKSGDPDPLPNTITVHYHPDGLSNDITDNATCTVDLRHPGILVTKSATPGTYRAGDNITYLLSVNNTGTDITLVKDSVTDSLAGDITSLFSDNITVGGSDNQTYIYTVKATDPDPLVNLVTVHYHPQGLPNDISDNTTCSVDMAPSITSVTPNEGTQGETLDIVIAGSQLNMVNAVDFGAGITVNSITMDSSTQITANISIDASAALEPRDVTVTNPIGSDTLTDAFTVLQSQSASPAGLTRRRASPPTSTYPGMSGPAQMSLQYLSVNPQQATPGQPVTVLTNVVNTGDEAGSYNVVLKINGQMEQSRMVSVGAQGTQPVKFTITKAQPGTYTVNIDDQKRSFTITAAGSSPNGRMGEGPLIATAMAVIVVLAGLLIVVARRCFQGY